MPANISAREDEEHFESGASCRQCLNPIQSGARLCAKCGSFQDIRGYLPVSSTVLAMIVALVTVVTASVQSLKPLLTTERSFLTLTNPIAEGGSIYIVAANTGKLPSVITSASISSPLLPGPVRLAPKTPSDTFIPTGAKQAIFGAEFHLTNNEAADAALTAFTSQSTNNASSSALLKIEFHEFNGKEGVFLAPLTRYDMFVLLDNHANRCRIEKDPTYENGCISNDELARRINAKADRIVSKLAN